MKAPAFWGADGGLARMLGPLEAITAAATARRVGRPGWSAPVPVFCCGNATLGGAGKTIVALDLGRRLIGRGRAVHFLSRGHGGARQAGVLRVAPSLHDAGMVGDEPLLLARLAPCWVGSDRAAAARAAIGAGAEVLVMDDGLQNPGIAGRHAALVIDGASGFGNGRLFPAGPLRESPGAAAGRCDIAILIGADATGALARLPPALPVLHAALVTPGAAALAGRRLHAFAGIARPAKFFASLDQAGACLTARIGFADHHRYSRRTLERLLRDAARAGAAAVTTAKDAVRLPPDLRGLVEVIGVELEWQRPEAIERWLDAA